MLYVVPADLVELPAGYYFVDQVCWFVFHCSWTNYFDEAPQRGWGGEYEFLRERTVLATLRILSHSAGAVYDE